jgi:hypothetical protein
MDDFTSLSNRLLSRAPAVGILLAEQLINDSWRTLQSRREWSWRRKSGVFAPPNLYQTGTVSTNVSAGSPYLITGVGTAWTQSMIGRQIRIGGLNQPYYTISGWLGPTQLILDSQWAGTEMSGAPYQILQCFYPLPEDFGYFDVAVSIKDAFRLNVNTTQAELAVWDPQRANSGQTYCVAFRDFVGAGGGVIGPVQPVSAAFADGPVSTTTLGYSYPADAMYVVQVVTGGASGVATFQWLRSGQNAFSLAQVTSDQPQDLSDGVQIYWPTGITYSSGTLYVINCTATLTQSVPRVELWPAPSSGQYLYPYLYWAKETDLTSARPNLPPPIASRGEVILEMALEKCATFPGADNEHKNPYFDLRLAAMHRAVWSDMLIDLDNNDQNLNLTGLEWQNWPYYNAGPWFDGSWRQHHSPTLIG